MELSYGTVPNCCAADWRPPTELSGHVATPAHRDVAPLAPEARRGSG